MCGVHTRARSGGLVYCYTGCKFGARWEISVDLGGNRRWRWAAFRETSGGAAPIDSAHKENIVGAAVRVVATSRKIKNLRCLTLPSEPPRGQLCVGVGHTEVEVALNKAALLHL